MSQAKEPDSFDANVRQPGLRAIAEMVGGKPTTKRRSGQAFKKIAERESDVPPEKFPSYWTKSLDDLMKGYHEVCAYSCFRIHPVTGARSADHFAPKSQRWQRVYEWSNYRLCCSRMNARKLDFGDVLDPFQLKPNWFQLELVGFTVFPNFELSSSDRTAIQATIERLGLNNFRRYREEDAERYWAKGYSLAVLKQESPFVASELYRQNRLNPGDAW